VTRCPECGAVLQLVTDGLVEEEYWPGYVVRGAELPRRRVCRPFLACSGCEFCIETRDVKKTD